MRVRALALAACLAPGAMLLSGCPVPIPPNDPPGSRLNVPDKVPDFIVPGATTRADVMLALGEPDRASENGRQFLYVRLRDNGGLVLVAGGVGGVGALGADHIMYHGLAVEFDDAGIVTNARVETKACTEWLSSAGMDLCFRDLPPAGVAGTETPGESFGGQTFHSTIWLPGASGSSYFWKEARQSESNRHDGILVVGQTGLLFYAPDADSKSEPMLKLDYADIVDLHMATWGLNSLTVVKRSDGTYDSFQVVRGNGFCDSGATKRADEALTLRWKAATGR